MEFSRQEYWSELPFPSPGDLPDPGIKPGSPVSPASAGGFFTTESPGKTQKPAWYFLNFQISKMRSFKMEVILGKSTRKKKERNLEVRVQFLAFALTSCVNLGKFSVFSEPQLPHL